MRIGSVSHAIFVLTMVALGLLGFVHGDFAPVWQPVPKGVFGREVLVYFAASISMAAGLGLVWRRSAAGAWVVADTYRGRRCLGVPGST